MRGHSGSNIGQAGRNIGNAGRSIGRATRHFHHRYHYRPFMHRRHFRPFRGLFMIPFFFFFLCILCSFPMFLFR